MPTRSLRFRVWLTLVLIAGVPALAVASNRYEGKYCAGTGDVELSALIDESFAFFHPNPIVPNVAMFYRADWDTFEKVPAGRVVVQQFAWVRLLLAAILAEPFFSTLERTTKLWYDSQTDGKTADYYSTIPGCSKIPTLAPEGVLPSA